MNDTLALTQGFPSTIGQSDALPFPVSISEKSAKQLPVSTAELMRNISSIQNDLVLAALEKRTELEFKAVREDVFPKYFRAIQALSNLARIVVEPYTIDRIASESFCEVEAEFREHGLAAFGTEIRDQSIFTVWTFRKLWDICEEINGMPLPADLRANDTELVTNSTQTLSGHVFIWIA